MKRKDIDLSRAKSLRAKGWTYQRIADALGVPSVATVYRALNPGAREKKRNSDKRWRDENREHRSAQNRDYRRNVRSECERCGGDRPAFGCRGPLCEACIQDDVDRRARQIEQWWAEGLRIREIADRLGWSLGHVGQEMHRLRAKGYRLPYRRAVHPNGGRPKWPEQVGASE